VINTNIHTNIDTLKRKNYKQDTLLTKYKIQFNIIYSSGLQQQATRTEDKKQFQFLQLKIV